MIGGCKQAKVLGRTKPGKMNKFFYKVRLVKVAMIVGY